VTLLLDTHAFLWFITNDPNLSAAAQGLIADPSNEILVSPASYWETAIKVSVGKYPLSAPYETLMRNPVKSHIHATDLREMQTIRDGPAHRCT